jgi:hypothetical protein
MGLMVPQNISNLTVFVKIFSLLMQWEIAMNHAQLHASNGSMNAEKTAKDVRTI